MTIAARHGDGQRGRRIPPPRRTATKTNSYFGTRIGSGISFAAYILSNGAGITNSLCGFSMLTKRNHGWPLFHLELLLGELYVQQGRWQELDDVLAWLDRDARAVAEARLLRARAARAGATSLSR